MRFLHTADWQIGMKAKHLGKAGEEVRKMRIRSARRLIERAVVERADFILVAGDVFEDNAIDRIAVGEIARILGMAGVSVFVIPGNHDAAVTGSVWENACWAQYANVKILLTNEPVAVPGGVLYPCPLMVPHSGADPTAWIPKREGEGIRIALAHGMVEGLNICDGNYPIPRDLPERAGLDYVALGHFHSTAFYGAPECERLAYSGTHEPTAFGERDSGNALLVEIGASGVAPKIEKIRTAVFDWLQIERSIDSDADLQSVLDELRALPCPEDKLVECRLTGYEPDGAQDLEQQIHDMLQHAFVFGRYEADLIPDHGHPQWIDNLPAGYLQDAAKELASMACAEPPNPDARRALRELGRICSPIVQISRTAEEVRA